MSIITTYIYAGPKTDQTSVTEIEARLEEFGVPSSGIVKLTDGSDLSRALGQRRATLIIPGADTLEIAETLKDYVKIIQNAVIQGVNYLGLGGGGNWACSKLTKVSGKGGSLSDSVPFLELLSVEAQYPVYPIVKTARQGGDNGKMVPIYTSQGTTFNAYWNEGSQFSIIEPLSSGFSDTPTSVRTDAYYADLKIDENSMQIAAVSDSYGNGTVVACGFHPEIDPAKVAGTKKTEKDESKEDSDSSGRINYLHKLFGDVGIKPKK